VIDYYRNNFVNLQLLCLVANQQTVVELIGFFQRAFPQNPSLKSAERRHIDQSEPLVNEVRILTFQFCKVSKNNYCSVLSVS